MKHYLTTQPTNKISQEKLQIAPKIAQPNYEISARTLGIRQEEEDEPTFPNKK